MAWAEFEEKEYEIAATVELGRRGDVFGAGQVLEAILGYDTAAAPGKSHVIWRVLEVPRPSGLRLIPAHWQPGETPSAGELPSAVVSLVLQYKRPEYLRGGAAKQWGLWRCAYFRITRTSDQQRILLRLERKLRDDALVRYAAPAFWQRGELEAAQLDHAVLSRSGFVRPTDIGSHAVWTYVEPGVRGRANPRGEERPFQTLDDLLASRELLLAPDERPTDLVPFEPGPLGHLRAVGAAALERNPRLRAKVTKWANELARRDIAVTHEQIDRLSDLAAIVTATDRLGASWHLLKV
jgi:hypothetical protein